MSFQSRLIAVWGGLTLKLRRFLSRLIAVWRAFTLKLRHLRLSLTTSVLSLGFIAPLAAGVYLARTRGSSLGPGIKPLAWIAVWYLALLWVCLGPLLRIVAWSKAIWTPVIVAVVVAIFERPESGWHAYLTLWMFAPLVLGWWSCNRCRRVLATRTLSWKGEKTVQQLYDQSGNPLPPQETEQNRHLVGCLYCGHAEERVVTLNTLGLLGAVGLCSIVATWFRGPIPGITATAVAVIGSAAWYLRRRLVPLA